MLTVEMTPRLLGFKVSGTHKDLDELYDAIWDLTVPDIHFDDDPRPAGTADEIIMSTRVLALCYDLRKAYEGARNIELTGSGMHECLKEAWPEVYQEHNVTFSVEVLYPEAMYEALALVYLSDRRERYLSDNASPHERDKVRETFLLDKSNLIVRNYLARLLAAVEKRATPARYEKIIRDVCAPRHNVPELYQQWVDVQNVEYALATPKRRAQRLGTVVHNLAAFDKDRTYRELREDVDAYAREHGISRDSVQVAKDDEELDYEW